jgi:hypothetical protein
MDSYTRVPQRVFVDLLEGPAATSSSSPRSDEEAARSQENVRKWMAYLPEDCIKAMIRMGWDVST